MRSSLALLVIAASLGGCHGRPTIEKTTAGGPQARHAIDARVVTAPGTVEPWYGEVKLASAEPGRLEEILVVEGQSVQGGELLARLESSGQRQAVLIAEAELRQISALLAGVTATKEELQAAKAELEAATARAEQRKRDSQRASLLGASGVLANDEVERALSASSVEDAARVASEARLLAVERGARSSERQLLRARWDSAQARVGEAAAALTRREVRATIDGTVLWSRYHAGEYYSPAQGPLFVVGDVQRPQVLLEVDDLDGQSVSIGAKVKLRTDAGAQVGSGTVARIAPAVGTRSLPTERPTARTDGRVREVFVAVDTPTTLAPGQRVWGEIELAARHAAR